MTEKELLERCKICKHLKWVYALDAFTCMYVASSNISIINTTDGQDEIKIDYNCDHFKRKG